jgi:DNA-directed RNA polymerase II subunit RPB2
MSASSLEMKSAESSIKIVPKKVRICKPSKKTSIVDIPVDNPIPKEFGNFDDTIASTSMKIKETIDSLKKLGTGTSFGKEDTGVLSHLGNYTEEPFTLIDSYFDGKHLERLVRHQIESYNHFVTSQIQRTIQMFNPVIIHSENDFIPDQNKYFLEVQIFFENFKLYTPQIHENNGATKMMFPQEAKLRNFTYASTMTVDIKIDYIVRNTESMDTPKVFTKILPKINIGKMPIMLKSSICVLTQNHQIDPKLTGECSMDCGGYFIIKGSEKTILGQERAAENRIYCFDGKNTTKWSWFAEIKSVPDYKCISPKQIEMMIAYKNNGFGHGLYITIPRIKQPIELFALFRALGVSSDKAICSYILLDVNSDASKELLPFLQASVIDSNKYTKKEDALKHITTYAAYTPINMDKETGARKKLEFTMEVLQNDLFPHCKTQQQKLYLLGYMAKKLIQTSLGQLPPDDRDSYLNKRIELTGTLLNNLFRNYFNKLVKETQKQIIREINTGSWRSSEDYLNIINMTNIYKIMKSTTIENGINRALSTGDFSIKQSNSSKVGVAQVLNRLTYVASLSHLRRINTPLEKSGELIAPRKLHNTTWGFLCPVESPEGQSIGVVKNISYMAHITIPSNSDSLYMFVDPHITSVDSTTSENLHGKSKVFINGCWVGVCDNALDLYNNMKDKKYKGIINIYTSIIFDYKLMELRICNDGGRLTRPVLRVRDNKALITAEIVDRITNKELGWNDLITSCNIPESVIEYIDPDEQNFAMIAMKVKDNYLQEINDPAQPASKFTYNYTHCEIHPSTIFGVLASCIPYPEHNQSPRNTYQSAMAKQAIGVYATNYDQRMDKTAYVLTYPSRPLVDTRLMNFIQLNKIPSGTQIHVAIMTHTGYNQEDSVLINKGSVDRGLFSATIYHTEKDEDKNIIRDEIIRCKPDPTKTKGIKYGNYDKLNSQGFIPENTLVENRDVIIAKTVPIKENRNDPSKVIKFEDQSKTFRTTEETYIDKNFTGRNGDGYNFAKVRVRIHRKPVLGDKFSSRHGQKGTCGNLIPECDMPFTKDGLRPDIILNPHAIPSRMTIGQLKETILGKVLLELGLFGDGTSFGDLDVNTIIQELQKIGYESYGNEIMYDGLTGEQMESSIFIGPVFYQRLKHMVNDKTHSRSIGPMVNLTRQPAEGRSRDGGFRIGEMERDVMLAHGMSRFCKERLYDVSDKYSIHVCKKCGMTASYNDGQSRSIHIKDDLSIHLCNTCGNRTEFSLVEIPYAFKLMSQELQTINIATRLITED